MAKYKMSAWRNYGNDEGTIAIWNLAGLNAQEIADILAEIDRQSVKARMTLAIEHVSMYAVLLHRLMIRIAPLIDIYLTEEEGSVWKEKRRIKSIEDVDQRFQAVYALIRRWKEEENQEYLEEVLEVLKDLDLFFIYAMQHFGFLFMLEKRTRASIETPLAMYYGKDYLEALAEIRARNKGKEDGKGGSWDN